jgi:hypothetical protein
MTVVNGIRLRHAFPMRFYMLPAEQGTTTLINFDHVAYINVAAKTIELHFIGVEAPMVITKTPTTLSLVAKGMDLSDNSKDLVNAL